MLPFNPKVYIAFSDQQVESMGLGEPIVGRTCIMLIKHGEVIKESVQTCFQVRKECVH